MVSIDDMDIAGTEAMLASTQQLRTHWSGVITSHLTLAVTINIGLFSYFGTAFIDSLNDVTGPRILLLYLASALSSFIVGLWRIYTRYIDNHIANLYPDLLLYEGKLKVPFDRGTSGYLVREMSSLSGILQDKNLTLEDKINGIAYLAHRKRVGDRGHKKFDSYCLAYIFALTMLSLFIMICYGNIYHYFFLFGNISGFIFIRKSLTQWQKNPCTNQISETLEWIKKEKAERLQTKQDIKNNQSTEKTD